MKLSLRWIFDHIDADYKKVDIKNLVDKFNKITAEIEGYEKFELDLKDFFLVQIKSLAGNNQGIMAFCKELGKELSLPLRTDYQDGLVYLAKRKENGFFWATVSDFGCEKDGLVPAIYVQEKELDGSWKKSFEIDDWIIEVDNKSITHRPDMWGHRGFAREIAAFLDLKLKKEDEFLKKFDEQEFKDCGKDENGFEVQVQDQKICKRFSGLYMPEIGNRPSSLWMASRLMRIGSRPIDFLVDTTNYVMQDISQPMHAFDVNKLPKKMIVARLAKKGEELELLDGSKLELCQKDYVITDGSGPVALAGVMGGKNSGISRETNSVFIEAANFEAASVRNSALRAKNRTDASARFEKTLDPNQNILGIFRLLKIFEQEGIQYKSSQKIISIGARAKQQEVEISHELIERLIGATIKQDFVVKTLEKLDFGVSKIENSSSYKISIPTFRSSKDIEIKEDVVEEIGRFFGYENTDFILPKKITQPYDLSKFLRERSIKKLLSFGSRMREVRNYAFYDESFLMKLNWAPGEFKEVTNPVSDNWRRLVTSLLPNLIKNIDQNFVHNDKLRFFELARTWNINKKFENGIEEKKVLAGVFYDKGNLDFYCAKSKVCDIFNMLGISVSWEKADEKFLQESAPWFFAYQTAKLVCDNKTIGHAGMLDQAFYKNIFEGNLFAFELDCDFLINYKPEEKKLEQISKYQDVYRDVSMFVPLAVTVDKIKEIITKSSEKIKSVKLLDFFQKNEWKDKKALTFRFIMQDYNKTMEKEEVDLISQNVVSALLKIGAELR